MGRTKFTWQEFGARAQRRHLEPSCRNKNVDFQSTGAFFCFGFLLSWFLLCVCPVISNQMKTSKKVPDLFTNSCFTSPGCLLLVEKWRKNHLLSLSFHFFYNYNMTGLPSRLLYTFWCLGRYFAARKLLLIQTFYYKSSVKLVYVHVCALKKVSFLLLVPTSIVLQVTSIAQLCLQFHSIYLRRRSSPFSSTRNQHVREWECETC